MREIPSHRALKGLPENVDDRVMTAEITFTDIAALVSSQEVQGSSVQVKFVCPTTGTEVESTGSLRRSGSIKDTAERSAKQNFMRTVQRSISEMVRSIFGSGAASRVASDVTRTAMTDAQKKMAFTKGEVEAGVVEAFTKVEDRFERAEDGSFRAKDREPAGPVPSKNEATSETPTT